MAGNRLSATAGLVCWHLATLLFTILVISTPLIWLLSLLSLGSAILSLLLYLLSPVLWLIGSLLPLIVCLKEPLLWLWVQAFNTTLNIFIGARHGLGPNC